MHYVQLHLWKASAQLGENNQTNRAVSILFLGIQFVTYLLQSVLLVFSVSALLCIRPDTSLYQIPTWLFCVSLPSPPKTMRCSGVIVPNLNNNPGFLLKMNTSAWKVIYPSFADCRALKGHTGRETLNCLENSQFDYNGQFWAYSLLVSILPKVASFVIKSVLKKCCGRNHQPNFYSAEESGRGLKYQNWDTTCSGLPKIGTSKASSEALHWY